MATGDKYLSCGTGKKLTATSELEEMLSALLVTDGTKVGFRYTTTTISNGSISNVVGCSSENLSIVDLLRRALTVDASGNPAIGLISAT